MQIRGSLTWDSTSNTLHFVRTSTFTNGEWTRATGPLPADTYTVTFNNPSDWGATLSTQTVTVAATSSAYLTLPDITRGPGQAVNALADGTAGNAQTTAVGIPIAYNPNGQSASVLSVDFWLNYNPADLTISGVQLDAALSAVGGWSVTYNNDAADGILHMSLSSGLGNPVPAGVVNLVDVIASVPSGATHGAGALLKLTNVVVNGGQVAAAGDEAVQKVAFLGDTSGYQSLVAAGGLDAAYISAVVVDRVSGFTAFADTDPIIIADTTGNAFLSGLDASYVAQASIGLSVPQIPNDPVLAPVPIGGNIDPNLMVGSVTANRGSTADVQVTIDNSSNLLSTQFVLSYYNATSRLSLTDAEVLLGQLLPGSGWAVFANVVPSTETINVTEYSTSGNPLPTPNGSRRPVGHGLPSPQQRTGGNDRGELY